MAPSIVAVINNGIEQLHIRDKYFHDFFGKVG